MRSLPLLLFPLLLVSCTDGDAPKPVPVSEAGTRAAAPSPPADPDDPAEAGISDLARLARYVYKAMQGHDDVCPFANPFRDTLHFAIAVQVKAGRITEVGLAHAGVEPAGAAEARTLSRPQWPPELTGYVACLAPHLKAVEMSPAPADGSYEPAYSFGGTPQGRPRP